MADLNAGLTATLGTLALGAGAALKLNASLAAPLAGAVVAADAVYLYNVAANLLLGALTINAGAVRTVGINASPTLGAATLSASGEHATRADLAASLAPLLPDLNAGALASAQLAQRLGVLRSSTSFNADPASVLRVLRRPHTNRVMCK